MTTQQSFSKFENKLLPDFRQKISRAESTEDVKKFFVYTIQELFDQVFAGKITLDCEDITLIPDKDDYCLADKLFSAPDFNTTWKNSDLAKIICRFSKTASKHYHHLQKNRQKTEAKIRKT